MLSQAQSTSGAEARMFHDCSCRPEGLLDPVVNNAGSDEGGSGRLMVAAAEVLDEFHKLSAVREEFPSWLPCRGRNPD
jgi:hypothetical protein